MPRRDWRRQTYPQGFSPSGHGGRKTLRISIIPFYEADVNLLICCTILYCPDVMPEGKSLDSS